MDDFFKFELGIGRYLWSACEVVIEVMIPRELHDHVANSIGTNKMAQLEFGFHFQQIVEKKFPELDVHIRQAITDWFVSHAAVGKNEMTAQYYSLQSSWFE